MTNFNKSPKLPNPETQHPQEIDQNREFPRETLQNFGQATISALRNIYKINEFHASDLDSFETFSQIFEKDLQPDNLMNFEKSPQELENWFTQKLESIRSDKNGDITIVGLASGSFDVPHENHTNFLRDCKNRLAHQFCEENDLPFSSEIAHEIIEKGLVKLIVSLDTDSRIDLRKSKPGDKRPVYALKDRASRISGLYVTSPNDTRTPVADIIIPEGAEYAGSIFENLQTLAKYGAENNLIDSRICFGEHPQDLTDAQESGLKPLVISDDLVYAFNKNGQRISSTNIINSSKALNQN
jgi:hypothetical protein